MGANSTLSHKWIEPEPMHVSFTSDAGGNTQLALVSTQIQSPSCLGRGHHSNGSKEMYGNDMEAFLDDIQTEIMDGTWLDDDDDVEAWEDCEGPLPCPNKYALIWHANGHTKMSLKELSWQQETDCLWRRQASHALNNVFGNQEDELSEQYEDYKEQDD